MAYNRCLASSIEDKLVLACSIEWLGGEEGTLSPVRPDIHMVGTRLCTPSRWAVLSFFSPGDVFVTAGGRGEEGGPLGPR